MISPLWQHLRLECLPSVVCVRVRQTEREREREGEWEAERGKGKGIVAFRNGGFPRPVSQTRHVTRPDISGTQAGGGGSKKRRAGGGGVGGRALDYIDRPVNQSHFVFASKSFFPLVRQLG